MQLQLQNFTTLVAAAAATVQGTARNLVDLTVGSTLRAMLEASASVALWVQWLVVQVLQTTRAGTSEGADLDSWMADFTVARLPSVVAVGELTFSRFGTTGTALVPAGTLARTGDGSVLFTVVAAASHAGWVPALGAYRMEAGAAAMTVPAAALEAGSAGNVQASAINLVSAALPGIDGVSNAAGFLGGMDAEDDTALRARFTRFLDSRARATPGAIAYAVAGVQQGVRHALLENVLPDGSPLMGSFVVAVDDGSGVPSASLLAAVGAAIEEMRPVGAIYSVRGPLVGIIDVAMSVEVSPGAAPGTVRDRVAGAIAEHINGLGMGRAVVWSRLFQVAYEASDQVIRVGSVVVNGGAVDVLAGPASVAKSGAIVVT